MGEEISKEKYLGVGDIEFFDEFNSKEQERLENISIRKKYQKGEILFYEGEEPKYLHLLLDGVLKIYKTDFKANQIFLHQFIGINFIAELANFESIPFPASSEFVTSGEVLKIEYEPFKRDFLSDPRVSFKMIKSLSNKLKIASEVMHKEIILPSEAKIAKFIVENGELFGMVKNVNIASILNLTPETLSRILTKMRRDKLVNFDEKHHLTDFDKDTLKSIYTQ